MRYLPGAPYLRVFLVFRRALRVPKTANNIHPSDYVQSPNIVWICFHFWLLLIKLLSILKFHFYFIWKRLYIILLTNQNASVLTLLPALPRGPDSPFRPASPYPTKKAYNQQWRSAFNNDVKHKHIINDGAIMNCALF